MKVKELREMTVAERTGRLEERKKEKFNMAIQSKTGQLENTARVRQVRREIARLKTVMAESLEG